MAALWRRAGLRLLLAGHKWVEGWLDAAAIRIAATTVHGRQYYTMDVLAGGWRRADVQ